MAKVTTPLLSFGATGQLGKTLVGFRWKGIDVMRQYVVPTNPKTAAQVTHRGVFADVVVAWRSYVTATLAHTAWDLAASVGSKIQSGFNAFMSSAIKVVADDADASYATACVAGAADIVTFTMLNMDAGDTGDEAGNFELWVGTAPSSLLLNAADLTIADSEIDSGDLGDDGDIVYVQLRKTRASAAGAGYPTPFDRSGIYKITLAD